MGWGRFSGEGGMAILSRLPITDAGDRDYARLNHARHVAARLENGITIHNFYVPAGGDIPDRDLNIKFGQKLDFLTDMRDAFHADRPAPGDRCDDPDARRPHREREVVRDAARRVGLSRDRERGFGDAPSLDVAQILRPSLGAHAGDEADLGSQVVADAGQERLIE